MLSNEWGWSLVGENRAGESSSDASVKTGGDVDKVLAKAEKASKSRTYTGCASGVAYTLV